jgi:hypothetical protein
MGFTIAPIAARRATSTSPILMTTERPRVECDLQDDPRLLAGVRAIVSHTAEQLGLPEQARGELADATLDVCREAFAMAGKSRAFDAAIKLIIGGTPDRLEITVDYPGETPERAAGKPCGAKANADRFGCVDDVRCENRGGRSRVTLIKQCDAMESKSGG